MATLSQPLPAAPCRVCGAADTSMLPNGQYAAFFTRRVDTSGDPYRIFSRAAVLTTTDVSLKLAVRALRKAWRMVFGKSAKPAEFRTFMTGCRNCHSLTPSHEYSFQDLVGLYRDYRSDAYNRERAEVEPSYAKIAKHVGDHPQEIANRNKAVDAFLSRSAQHFSGGLGLDYGGSDGRFISSFLLEKLGAIHIFEPSDAPLHPSVDGARVSKTGTPQKGTYAFLACMHVLEHVGNPRGMVMEAADYLMPDGLMYIEVPHELDAAMKGDFDRRIVDTPVLIHEHVNKFDRLGMTRLVESVPALELVDSDEEYLDLGWTGGVIGRFLVRKRS